MTVVSTTKDPEALTMTVVADLAATPKRAWQLWADPDQLGRWWGPPTWPATFEQLDLEVGGRAAYYMTGPDGEKAHGWWRFLAVDEPSSLELDDGFADELGVPSDEMPVTRMRLDLTETADGTRMTITSHFASVEQMEQLISMGMQEGMAEALGQIDGILAAG